MGQLNLKQIDCVKAISKMDFLEKHVNTSL